MKYNITPLAGDEYGFDLYYYGARYMDPSSGRFITPDPVKDFYNPYSYVSNNPMNRIDPTGMAAGSPFIIPVISPPLPTGPPKFIADMKWADLCISLMGSFALQKAINTVIDTKYSKEIKEITNNISDLKKDVKTLADSEIGPNYWHLILNELDNITDDHIRVMAVVKHKLSGLDVESWASYDNINDKYEIDADIGSEGFSKTYIKCLILHEVVHAVYNKENNIAGRKVTKSEFLWSEAYAKTYQMLYYDKYNTFTPNAKLPYDEVYYHLAEYHDWKIRDTQDSIQWYYELARDKYRGP